MSGRPAPAEAQGHKEGKELKLDHWHPSDLKNVGDSQWRDPKHHPSVSRRKKMQQGGS